VRAVVLTAALVLAASLAAGAQERPTFTFHGAGAVVWVRSDTAGGAVRLRGPALAGEGRVGLHGVTLGVGFLEGRLRPVGAATPRDLIEGRVLIAARPLPWLEMSAGPVVRAYVTTAATERWVFWQARARVDAPIVTTTLTSYLELWRALSSQVNQATPVGRVQGGEAGVLYRPPRGSVWMRLGYRVDDAALGAGGETLEAISLAVGVGRP